MLDKKWQKMAKILPKYRKILQNCPKITISYCIGVVLVLQGIFFISYWYRVDFLPKNDSRIGIGLKKFWTFFLSYWYRDGFFGHKFWILVLYRPDQNSKCRTLVTNALNNVFKIKELPKRQKIGIICLILKQEKDSRKMEI